MKLVGFGLMVVGLVGGAVVGQTTPGAGTLPAATAATTSRPAVAALTGMPVVMADNQDGTKQVVGKLGTIMDFRAEASLRKVTDRLRDDLKVNLAVNWGDLKSVGVMQETMVSLELADVSAHEVLQQVLERAAPGKLDYDVSDGVVEVATRGWFERQAEVRTYPTGPLLGRAFHPADGATGAAATQPVSAGEKLADLMREMAIPEIWKVKGNALGFGRGEIMVGAGVRAQWEVSELYADLLRPIRVPVDKGDKLVWPPQLKETPGHRTARERLDRDIEALAADRMKLRDVLAFMTKAQGIGVQANWRALEGVKIGPETEVTVKWKEASLRQVIAALLGVLSPGGELVLDISPEGVLTVTTKAARPERAVTAVFDGRDLIRRQIFMAHGTTKPGTVELAGKIMTDLQAAGEKAGWWKEAVVREWEGLVVVRGTPDVVRAAGEALGSGK